MYKNNPYAKIKENAINTSTPEELTLMLYDGAVRFANQAIIALEKKDYYNTNKYIQKCRDIVREFQLTLNMKYDISHELYAAYDYMHRRLTEANMKKDIEILNEILEYLKLFRDTWKEAMRIARASR